MDENTFWFALASSDALLWARGLKNAYPDLDVTIQEADVAPHADPGSEVEGPDARRSSATRSSTSSTTTSSEFEIAGHPGRRHAHGLDVRGRLRDLPHRHLEGHRALRGGHEGRRAVQREADRPERHPPHRGRDLQLGRRHDLREQPVRDGPRPARRRPARGRLHLDQGAEGDQGRRRRAGRSTASSSTATRSPPSTT